MTLDFTGLSLNEAIVKTARFMDTLYERTMNQTLRLLVEHGATDEEIASECRHQHEAFMKCRSEVIASLCAFYAGEGNETIH